MEEEEILVTKSLMLTQILRPKNLQQSLAIEKLYMYCVSQRKENVLTYEHNLKEYTKHPKIIVKSWLRVFFCLFLWFEETVEFWEKKKCKMRDG